MDAKDVKDILSLDDMVDLLHELNASPIKKGNVIYCKTICHGGERRKLIYYEDTKTFSCFTDSCGHGFDVFILVGKVFGMDFTSAFRYVCSKFRIQAGEVGTGSNRVDTSFIKKFKKKELTKIDEIDQNILNSYYNFYHKSWVEDGISIETMKKFNIRYSIMMNKIIIPHYDIEGKLLGVRGRALEQDEIDAGKKYMPIFHKNEVLKHPTGANIYGLNVTKESIRQYKTIILFEAEKSVMQLDTMWPEMSIGGAISGSSLSQEQIRIMLDLGVENVILALDKEWENENEEKYYKRKIGSGFIEKLMPYFSVSIIWDKDNLIGLKQSPTDGGKEVFEKLYGEMIRL